jgi:hypothetical protein
MSAPASPNARPPIHDSRFTIHSPKREGLPDRQTPQIPRVSAVPPIRWEGEWLGGCELGSRRPGLKGVAAEEQMKVHSSQ